MKRPIFASVVTFLLLASALALGRSWWWPSRQGVRETSAASDQAGSVNALPDRRGRQRERDFVVLSDTEQERLGLETVPVDTRIIYDVFRVNGMIRPVPDRIASVSSREEGRAVRVLANVGETVEKEQVLVELNSAEVERLQAQLFQARNQLRLAGADLDRIRSLVEKGIVARKELLQKEAQVKGMQEEVEGLRKRLALHGLGDVAENPARMGQPLSFPLRAPLGGVVLSRQVSMGEVVPSGKVLFTVANLRQIRAQGEVFEAQAGLLRQGLLVKVQVPAYPDRIFSGKIEGVGHEIEPARRTVGFWADLENPGLLLKPNMSAEITVLPGRIGQKLTVPLNAIIREGSETVVFVREGEDRYRRTHVALGVRDDQYAEVKQGLHAGDRVVTTGKRQLYTVYRLGRSGGELEEMGGVD
jgi:cobalt-zinc-cadmium efflux system membrane fusion protein